MNLKASLNTLSFAVMMAASSMSHALDTDWGTVTPGSTIVKPFSGGAVGPFSDKYSFSLLTDGFGALQRNVVVTLDDFGVPESGFTGLTYGLYTSSNVLLAVSSFEAATKKFVYSALSAGSYYLKVSGTGFVSDAIPTPTAPVYRGLAVITASVPEPETYAMFLAGLGIVATVVRRRSRSF